MPSNLALATNIKFQGWEYTPDERKFDDAPTATTPFPQTDPTTAVPYKPRPHFLPFHNREQRWAALVCHRRAGKTVACVAELVHRALYTKKHNARYAYVAPFFRQAKDVAWVYLKDMVRLFAIDIRESELRIILPNGAWITLYGADNPDALRGLYLDGAILDEFGDCRPNLWAEVILPTLMDRRGWCVFIGTPKGKNEFHKIVSKARSNKGWYDLTLKASLSNILSTEDLAELRELQTEDEYAQEFECSFEAAIQGSYYGSLIAILEQNGHIKQQALYDPQFPVFAAADLGYTDSTAFWFWQQRPDGLAIIDYYEEDSKPLNHYFDMLDHKAYDYDTIWLPHDARAKTLQTGRSTIEQFLAHDYPVKITPSLKVQQGIDAARFVMPSCYFDEEKCTLGIEALRAYRRRYDDVNKCFSNHPLHDWSSHGSDAFRYLSLVAKEHLPKTNENQSNVSRFKPPSFTPLQPAKVQLEPLFKEREERQHRRRGIARIC